MNTVNVVLLTLAVLVYLFALYEAAKNTFREKDATVKRLKYAILFIMLFVGVFFTLVTLNAFGIARIPVFNQVTRTMPDDYTPNTGLSKPPIAGSTQPPSQPAIDTHKEQMDKLKREGL